MAKQIVLINYPLTIILKQNNICRLCNLDKKNVETRGASGSKLTKSANKNKLDTKKMYSCCVVLHQRHSHCQDISDRANDTVYLLVLGLFQLVCFNRIRQQRIREYDRYYPGNVLTKGCFTSNQSQSTRNQCWDAGCITCYLDFQTTLIGRFIVNSVSLKID